MSTKKSLLGALFAISIAAFACGDDTNNNPTSTFTTSTGGSGGEGAGTQGGGGAGNGGDAQGGNGTGGACEGEDGCFSCTPNENEEFLNACTDATCVPFDNERRLPLYNGGDLPPIP